MIMGEKTERKRRGKERRCMPVGTLLCCILLVRNRGSDGSGGCLLMSERIIYPVGGAVHYMIMIRAIPKPISFLSFSFRLSLGCLVECCSKEGGMSVT